MKNTTTYTNTTKPATSFTVGTKPSTGFTATVKDTTSFAIPSKLATDYSVPNEVDLIQLNSTSVTLDSITIYLTGYTAGVIPPNKPSTGYANG
jgi:hypothetical protein